MTLGKIPFIIITMIIMASLISCEIIRSSRAIHEPLDTKPRINAVFLLNPRKQGDKKDDQSESEHSCQDQLVVKININPSFRTEKCEKYFILDEAYDPEKHTKAKILAPYLFELSRGEPVMMYPLQYDKSINCNSCGNPKKKPNFKAGQKPKSADRSKSRGSSKNERMASLKPIDVKKLTAEFEKTFREENGLKKPENYINNIKTTMENVNKSINEINNEESHVIPSRGKHSKSQKINRSLLYPLLPSFIPAKLDSKLKHDEELFKRYLTKCQKTKKHEGQSDYETSKESTFREDDLSLDKNSKKLKSKREKNTGCFDDIMKEISKSKRNPSHQKCIPGKLKKPPDKTVYQHIQYKNEQKDVSKNMINKRQFIRFNKRKVNTNAPFSNMKFESDQDGKLTTSLKTCNFLQTRKTNSKSYEPLENHIDVISHIRKRRSVSDTTDQSFELKYGKFNAKKFLKSDEMLNLLHEASEIEPQYPNKNNYMTANNFKDNELKFSDFNNITMNNGYNNNYEWYKPLKHEFDLEKQNIQSSNNEMVSHQNSVEDNYNDKNKYDDESIDSFLDNLNLKIDFANVSSNLDRLNTYENLSPTKELSSFDDSRLFDHNMDESYKSLGLPSLPKIIQADNHGTSKEMLFSEHYDKDGFHHFPPLLKDANEDDNLLNKLKPMSWFDTTYKLKSYGRTKPITDRRHQTIIGKPSNSKISTNKAVKENQFDSIISDPGLDFKDKMTALKYLNPNNDDLNRKYEILSKKLLDTKDTPRPLSMNKAISPLFSKTSPNLKTKRSFLMYADLESKDPMDDFDYVFGNFNCGSDDHNTIEEDIQSCSTCGGKKKKPPPSPADGNGECKVRLHKSNTYPRVETNKNDVFHIEPLCTSCGGKNKKPGTGKPCFEEDTGCQCRNLKTSCYCKTRKREINPKYDNWYSVYKMNTPFPYLTTRIRIFRKCHNTWWKIAPSIIMNSISANYANGNLTTLFSSHVDIFQLEKSLRLKNHKILIPKKNNYRNSRLSNTQRNIIRNSHHYIDLKELNNNPELILHLGNLDKEKTGEVKSPAILKNDNELCNAIQSINMKKREYPFAKYLDAFRGNSKKNDVVQTITDLGLKPGFPKVLSRCPQDKNHLCFNTREDKAPAINIKIIMPFCENSLLYHQTPKVKITQIIVDATTKNVLVLRIDIINNSSLAQLFEVRVPECVDQSARNNDDVKYSKNKFLAPLIGATVYFILPRTDEKKKFECSVIVATTEPTTRRVTESKRRKNGSETINLKKSPKSKHKNQVIASRNMKVVSDSTCYCVWKCNCHCINKIESFEDIHSCYQMDIDSLENAGLLQTKDFQEQGKNNPLNYFTYNKIIAILYKLTIFAIFVVAGTFLLGFLKALFGLLICSQIDEFGFNYVRLGRSYECSSKKRRFFINTFFFILLPFVRFCKCCDTAEQDLLLSKSSWRCRGGEDQPAYVSLSFPSQFLSEDEDVILEKKVDIKKIKYVQRSSGGENLGSLCPESVNMPYLDDLLEDDPENEDTNIRYVLQALSDSREAMRKVELCAHTSETTIEDGQNHTKFAEANDLVQTLKNSQIVYRIFCEPVGNLINIPSGMRYCIKGYFLPSVGPSYEFINYSPLAQYICLTSDKICLAKLHPPVYLNPADFTRIYKNKLEVLEAKDLVCKPPLNIPCLNVTPSLIVPDSVANIMKINVQSKHRQTLSHNIFTIEESPSEDEESPSVVESNHREEYNLEDDEQCR